MILNKIKLSKKCCTQYNKLYENYFNYSKTTSIDNIYVSNTFLIKIIKSVKTAVLLFNIINNGIVTVTGISILIYIISSN